MIKHPDVDETERIFQASGDEFVRVAWFGDAARVVVQQYARGGISLQSLLDDLTRMDTGALRLAFSECL